MEPYRSVKAVGDKRSNFARLELRALERIDQHVPKGDRVGVRNVYLTLCQVAAIEFDYDHDGFAASRAVLMAKGHISENTLDKHLATVQRLGLVDVEIRTSAAGQLPNRYVLVDSPDPGAPLSTVTATPAPPATVAGGSSTDRGAATPQPLPPLRARPEPVETRAEREREGARADQGIGDQGGGGSELERATVAELAELMAARGQELSARDRMSIRGVLHATPDGVDPVAAAARLRRNYGPEGKAERRTIGSVAALLAAEIRQSTAERAETERSAAGTRRRRRRRGGASEPPKSAAARRAAGGVRTHSALPAGLEPPTPAISDAWARARNSLRQAVTESTWEIWLKSLGLAGVLITLVGELNDDVGQPHQVVVLDAPEETMAWIATRFSRLVQDVLEQAIGERVSIELAIRPDTAAVA